MLCYGGEFRVKLSDAQKDFFETFGFLAVRQLLSPDEVATMLRESNEIMEEVRGGSAFDGVKRQAVQPFFERRPFLHSLIADPRILGIAEGLLGPEIFLNVTEGNLHVGDTAWHGGSGSAEVLPSVKIAFYLEALAKENGALRFIPGSHKGEFSKRLARIQDQADDPYDMWGVSPDEAACLRRRDYARRRSRVQGGHLSQRMGRESRQAPARHQLPPNPSNSRGDGSRAKGL